MIVDSPVDKTRLGVGFQNYRGRSRDEAWRRAIGTKPIPARLALLPEEKNRWDRVGLSALLQISILAFFVSLPVFFPERLSALKYQVTPLEWLVTEVPTPPPPVVRPKIIPKPAKPEPVEEVKLEPKKPHIFVQQKAFAPQTKKLEVKTPEVSSAPVFEAELNKPVSQPKRPREDVKVDNLKSTGSAAQPTVNLPLNKVQTGGFGDPNGLAGKGNPNKGTNINRLGSPALPGGPGYGNGTGGATGVRGTVASTGFGNGVAVPPPSGGKHGSVQTAGFADATATDAPKKKALPGDSPTTMVDILDKPRPQYTNEGRTQRIEGDVVLDVVFLADGRVQVNNIVSGLGHGLDEAAAHAAQQIKFKPAKRDGYPVDFPARVRIEFRLAY
jgi:TonB family protein